MSLHVKAKDVPERKVVRTGVEGEGAMVVRRGSGNECSLMHAVRAPGYHTTPHAHEAEQINYVLEGEIWFFVEERGFLCKAGDYQRIPAHKIHWAWNRSNADAVVVEAHAPALVAGKLQLTSIGLSMKVKYHRCDSQARITSCRTIGRAWNTGSSEVSRGAVLH